MRDVSPYNAVADFGVQSKAGDPLITVIMPVLNAERYVRKAIDSILSQTQGDFEFLIFDDGSTDSTPQILAEYANRDKRIRVRFLPHQGLVPVLNEGVNSACGTFIARMDADDVAMPERFSKQVEFLRANPDVVAVGCRLRFIDSGGRPINDDCGPTSHEGIMQMLLCGRGGIPHPSAMIRRRAVVAIGGYRKQFAAAEDVDLWLRLADRGRFANLDEVLLKYRVHFDTVSIRDRALQSRSAQRAVRAAYARWGQPVPDRCVESEFASESRFDTHLRWATKALNHGNYGTSRHHAIQAIRYMPLRFATWRLLANGFLADPHLHLLQYLRAIWHKVGGGSAVNESLGSG